MVRLVLFRLLAAIPVLLAAAVVTFVLFEVVPGDAALVALGDRATPAEVAALRHEMGLDRPAPVRLAAFLGRLAQGDLGRSVRSGRPVAAELADRIPYTLGLTATAVAVGLVLGVVAGALAAARAGGSADLALAGASALLLATPVFALALPFIALLGLRWGMLPVAGAGTWRHLVLPALTLALPSAAAFARLSRAAIGETLGADYVRAARAKGLPAVTLYAWHVWPNAAAPVLAFFGIHLGSLLGGAVVVETLFGWPGLGGLAVQSILSRDLPLAQGTVLVLAAGVILANALADAAHRVLDPRLR